MPRAVLIDVDGTLVESTDAHAHAWVETLAEFGRQVEFSRVRRMIGMGGDKVIPALAGVPADSDEGKRIGERRRRVFLERWLRHVRSFRGARELLARMKSDGLRLVVASSANDEELRALLRIVQADDLLDDETSSDDAERSKPDPDIVGAALGKAGVPAEEAIMLGDTPYDVEAATRAHVAVIALRCGGWSDDDLRGAIALFDDPADLLANYARSPLASGRADA